jgi:cytoskeletal protein CcmA (bactofilin family)
VIGGKVIGNLTVHERVELEVNSSLIGDLNTKDLIINEGAVFHGNCTMDKGNSNII